MTRTAAELKFIDQYTRKLMVKWAHDTVVGGVLIWATGDKDKVFYDYARSKGWISKKDDRVLAGGFSTAAAFLKR